MKKFFKSMLAMLAVVFVGLAVFTACSDDDDDDQVVMYVMGFSEMSTSDLQGLQDMGVIESAYKKELDVTEVSFTKKGSIGDCDKAVRAACANAYDKLKGTKWHGSFTFQVQNINTGKVIYEQEFLPDDENII